MQRRHLLQAAPALLLAASPLARAQAWPARPIRYIVPVAAGGGSDMVGRTVTERWGKLLNQTFVVDNQGGGGGVIACQAAARAAPDGYTLLQGYVATHGTSPATRKLPYDPVKDFTPVGMIGGTPNVLVVNSQTAGGQREGVRRLPAQEPGAPELRLGRPGLAHPPDDGAVQAADRLVHGAHSLPRHRAGLHRPHGRPDAGHVPGPGGGAAAHPRRAACARWP